MTLETRVASTRPKTIFPIRPSEMPYLLEGRPVDLRAKGLAVIHTMSHQEIVGLHNNAMGSLALLLTDRVPRAIIVDGQSPQIDTYDEPLLDRLGITDKPIITQTIVTDAEQPKGTWQIISADPRVYQIFDILYAEAMIAEALRFSERRQSTARRVYDFVVESSAIREIVDRVVESE